MVTLGVAHVPTARLFYERIGYVASGFESDDVCFFETEGSILGLFCREALAQDAGVPDDGGGFRGVACALNVDSEAAVDAALDLADKAGGLIVKPAEHVFWGGYSGYFSDPDGHLWEVAYNPVFPLNSKGRLDLPPPKPNSDPPQ
jgi:predicted lactoylglutathione lyase